MAGKVMLIAEAWDPVPGDYNKERLVFTALGFCSQERNDIVPKQGAPRKHNEQQNPEATGMNRSQPWGSSHGDPVPGVGLELRSCLRRILYLDITCQEVAFRGAVASSSNSGAQDGCQTF